jgi:FkbM family methyltransferase
MLFFHSCRNILRNPGVQPLLGLARHCIWHWVRRMAPLPLSVRLTPASELILEKRAELNGCVALAWSQQLYDYNNMSFLLEVTQHPECVRSCFDVGGNLGIYSLLMSEHSSTEVTCFEPHPQTHRSLLRILSANARQNVQVRNVALSESPGTLSFTDDDFNAMNKVVAPGEAGPQISIAATTGALVCQELGHAPDLMKVDTEGHEAEVLRGFGPWLQQVKILLVEENLPPDVLADCLPARSFRGPLYLDYQARSFSPTRQWPEDAFYLNHSILPALQALGFTISDS